MTRIKYPFNPSVPIKKLWGEFSSAMPIRVDWSDNNQDYDRYSFYEAHTCEECGRLVVTSYVGEIQHCDVYGENTNCTGYLYPEGAMMNYAYPISTERVGSIESAALLIADLPLCLAEWEGSEFLALTGGGMDLSWEICAAYMRLGFLPPVHFSDLPQYAGMTLNRHSRWILAGMRQSIKIQMRWLNSDLARLAQVRKGLQENNRRSS